MTEQSILGEMLDRMIEQDADMKAEVTQGVGCGTSNIQPGMEKGEFDLYSEYTGTGWNMVMKKDGRYSEDLFKDMQKEYKEKLAKRKYPSIAYELAEQIEKKTDKEVRITVPGHTQRGGSPCPYT